MDTLHSFFQYLLDNLPAAGGALMAGILLLIIFSVGLIVRSIIPKD